MVEVLIHLQERHCANPKNSLASCQQEGTSHIEALGVEYKALKSDLETAQSEANQYRENAEEAQRQLEQNQSRNVELRHRLEQVENDLTEARAYASETERLRAELDEMKTASDIQKEKLREQCEENDSLRQQLEALATQAESNRYHAAEVARLQSDLAAALARECELKAKAEKREQSAPEATGEPFAEFKSLKGARLSCDAVMVMW